MAVSRMGVVGAGQMGSGIAQVAATCGLKVIMTDIADELLKRGRQAIDKSLSRLVARRIKNEAMATRNIFWG